MAEDRLAIFIDGSNLYHALRSNFQRYDLNFDAFTTKLCGTRKLFRTYYYNVLQDPALRPEGSREQGEFLDILNKTPYLEVRLGGSKLSQGVPVEKGVDIMLATDLVNFAWRDYYDVAIIVSGDADFAYALQSVKNMGKYIEVAYFEGGISRDLLTVADRRLLLDRDFFNGLWARQRKIKPRRAPGPRGRPLPARPMPMVEGFIPPGMPPEVFEAGESRKDIKPANGGFPDSVS